MHLEPVVLLGRQCKQGFPECTADRLQRPLAGTLFLGPPQVADQRLQRLANGLDAIAQRRVGVVVDHPGARPGRQVDERRIDHAVDVAAAPRPFLESLEGDQFVDTGAVSIESDAARRRRVVQVELQLDLAEARHRIAEFVNEASVELPRRDGVGFARGAVADPHLNTCLTDAVAQFRCQIPIELLAAELANARQQRPDVEGGASFRHQRAPRPDRVALVAPAHRHLVQSAVGCRGAELQVLAERPEAQKANAELPLDALGAVLLQPLLDRIADVGGHIAEVRHPGGVPTYPFAIVDDLQERLVPLPAADDLDVLGPCIDAVLDELGGGLERIVLRQRDDADRGPVVTDAQLATRGSSTAHGRECTRFAACPLRGPGIDGFEPRRIERCRVARCDRHAGGGRHRRDIAVGGRHRATGRPGSRHQLCMGRAGDLSRGVKWAASSSVRRMLPLGMRCDANSPMKLYVPDRIPLGLFAYALRSQQPPRGDAA